jgi:hypothetical protein
VDVKMMSPDGRTFGGRCEVVGVGSASYILTIPEPATFATMAIAIATTLALRPTRGQSVRI